MNVFFFLLVAILGSHVEGIKIRATRRRFIEYPQVSETQYVQRVPIHRDPEIDRRYKAYGGRTYSEFINRNGSDTINKPLMFWAKEIEPATSQLGEGRSGQINDIEQNLRKQEDRIDISLDQSESSLSQRLSSENEGQNNNTMSPSELNSTNSIKIDDIDVLIESYPVKTGPLSVTIGKVASNNENVKNEEINGLPSLSTHNFIVTNKGDINTVDQSDINVKNNKKSPQRYVEYNMLPPHSRWLYSVNGNKINKGNDETPLYNNMDEVTVNKGYNGSTKRLVHQNNLIALDADGKYSVDQSKYNLAGISPHKDVEDEINVSNAKRIGIVNEFPKQTKPNNILYVINDDRENNMVPVHLTAEDDFTSTGDDSKYFIDESLGANTETANYTYDEKEIKEKNRVLLRPNQQQITHEYEPRNIVWKQVNISRGKQPHSIIYNKRRWRKTPAAINASLLDNLFFKLCRKCEYLMKALNISLSDNLETINIPQEGISWDDLQDESQEEPIYDVRYYQPHTEITKVLKEDHPQINRVKTLYGYRGANTFEQPQFYPGELVDDEIETILPNANKPQRYPLEPMNHALQSRILMKGKHYLQTPADQHPAETEYDFSKSTKKILHLEDVFDTKGDSERTPGANNWKNVPEQLTPSVVDASEIHVPYPELHDISNIPEYLLSSKSTDSAETPTAHITATPEELLTLQTSDETEIPATFTTLITSKATIAPDLPTVSTSAPNDWNPTSEELLHSDAPDMSDSTTYDPLVTDQNDGKMTPEEFVASKAPDTSETLSTNWNTMTEELIPSKVPVELHSQASEASETHTTNLPLATNTQDETTVPEELSSKASEASESLTTYSSFVANQKDENTTPNELLLTKATEADFIPITYAPYYRKDDTTIAGAIASDSFETLTAIQQLVTDWKDGTTTTEEFPLKGYEAPTTNTPLATKKEDETTIPEKLPSKASKAAVKPTTVSPLATNTNDGTTKPEELHSQASEASETPITNAPLATNTQDEATVPEELPSTAFEASETPTIIPSLTTNRKDVTTRPKELASKVSDASNTSTTYVSLVTYRKDNKIKPKELPSSIASDASKKPITYAAPVNNEKDGNDQYTTYVPLSNERSTISTELLPSKATETNEILTTLTPLATHRNTIPEKSLTSKPPVEIDLSTTNIPLYQSTISEEFLPSKASEAIEITTLSTPFTTPRNTMTEKLLPSEAPDAANLLHLSFINSTDWSDIPEDLLPSKLPDVSAIPVSVIYDWDITEHSESPKAPDESEIPTGHTPIPTGWAITTEETVPSKVPDVFNITTTDIPDDWRKPEQMISQAPGESEIDTASPNIDDWIDIQKKTLLSKISLNLGTSYTQKLNDENNQSEKLPNLEETTPEQYISQVINVLIPDLLKLYSSKCYKGVDEELLIRLKAVIDAVQEKQCETSQEYY